MRMLRCLAKFTLLSSLLLSATVFAQSVQIMNDGGSEGDPTVIWVPELQAYLGARTDNSGNGGSAGITLYESNRLEDLFNTSNVYYVPAATGAGYEAPALLEWNGHLYIDYRDTSATQPHQVVQSANVTDPFCQITPNCWTQMATPKSASALPGRDYSYLVHDNTLYAFTAGVFIQAMIDPITINTARPMLTISTANSNTGSAQYRSWEFRDNASGGTNEAPWAFNHYDSNGKLLTFVDYSANSYMFGDYDMGLLTFTGDANTPLDTSASLWVKGANPFLQASNYSTTLGAEEFTCNVGSNAVVQSPDGTELWDVYNSKSICFTVAGTSYGDSSLATVLRPYSGRNIRIQPITFDTGAQTSSNVTGGGPLASVPLADGQMINAPSGESQGTFPREFFVPGTGSTSQIFYASTGQLTASGTCAGGGTAGTQVLPDQVTGQILFSSDWTATTCNQGASGDGTFAGTLVSASSNNSYFVVSFYGSEAQLYGPTGSYSSTTGGSTTKQGLVNIYVDGNTGSPVTVNLGSMTSSSTALFYDTGAITPGQHTLLVVTQSNAPVQLNYVNVTSVTVSPLYTPLIATTTSLSVPSGNYDVNSSFTITATVTPAVSATISFYDGSNLLGTATSSASTGIATFNVTGLTGVPHILKAIFPGSTTYGYSSGIASVTVLTDNVWIANANSTISEVVKSGSPANSKDNGGGTAIAINNSGDVWSLNQSSSSLSEFTNSGTLLSTGTTIGGLNAPTALAIDGAGLAWVANGNGTVSVLSAPTIAVSTAAYQVGASTPTSLNIDAAGNLWLTNAGDSSVTEVFGAASPVPMPVVTGVINRTLGSEP